MVEYHFFGDWDGGYKLVSLAWHMLGAAGVYLFARRGLGLEPA